MMAMPLVRANSKICFCSSRVSIQPVGLPGEAMKKALVLASQASNSFCRSSFHLPDAQSSSSRTSRGVAPAILAAWKMLGQIGETMTILSPVSTTHCSAEVTASIAAPGTVMRSTAMSAPDVRLWKAANASRKGRMPRAKV